MSYARVSDSASDQCRYELDALVSEAGRILSRYVEPEGINADEALDALIYLFDGPQQRAAQKAWREAVDQSN